MSVDLNPAWFGRLDMQHPTDGIASHLHIVDEETFFQTYIQHMNSMSRTMRDNVKYLGPGLLVDPIE